MSRPPVEQPSRASLRASSGGTETTAQLGAGAVSAGWRAWGWVGCLDGRRVGHSEVAAVWGARAEVGAGVGRRHFAFFFQAEDGIRDDLVTGVQTCALPIFAVRHGEGNWPGLDV